jgi:hypothetical protein
MELVARDEGTVTIRMSRKTEFATLLAVFAAATTDFEKLDPEILNFRKEEVELVEDALFQLCEADNV